MVIRRHTEAVRTVWIHTGTMNSELLSINLAQDPIDRPRKCLESYSAPLQKETTWPSPSKRTLLFALLLLATA